jgi:tol-pal system protein YbgF
MKSSQNHRRPRAKVAAQPAYRLVFSPYFLLTLAALGACFLLAPRADAQVFSSQPYVAAPDPAVEQLRIRIETLEADLKRATDKAESLGAALGDARRVADDADAGRKRAETALAALTARVEALEDQLTDAGFTSAPANTTTGAVSLTPAGPAVAAQADAVALPEDETAMFEQAKGMLLNEGNFPGAQAAFTTFLTKFPKSKQAGDAQYYLGESLLYQDNFTDAATAYGKLIKDYPQSSNAPTGLVKLARSLRLLGNNAQACRTLSLMSSNFPKASAVAKQLASQERQQAKCA